MSRVSCGLLLGRLLLNLKEPVVTLLLHLLLLLQKYLKALITVLLLLC